MNYWKSVYGDKLKRWRKKTSTLRNVLVGEED